MEEPDQLKERQVYDLVEKLKAQLCACGDRQQAGIDCGSTLSPTTSLMKLRLLLVILKGKGWHRASFDKRRVYLYIPVEELVYIQPPVELIPNVSVFVMQLWWALYGMKQEGQCWWIFLVLLYDMGFLETKVEKSLYLFKKQGPTIAIWLHVDGSLVISNCVALLDSFHPVLDAKLKITCNVDIRHIAGIDISQCSSTLYLSQPTFAEEISSSYNQELLNQDSPRLSN
ncbi:hypothetical protein O181_036610 [Austropuccinia psidii MF-1]|uniref:Reverse transcriptase Ty1/copia-type domain-containing protein n=1 Tax=Austropuccinia psidii MF-1 TaxID=1389203 RepID=A0A9Q3D9A0_9BASI|nr:hypothetical protein [Austropuccinia psidii MF-1]